MFPLACVINFNTFPALRNFGHRLVDDRVLEHMLALLQKGIDKTVQTYYAMC